jgi:predicted ferric reductase
LGAVIALHISTRSGGLALGGGSAAVLTEIGRVAGLIGTYFSALVVLLAARIPVIEREVGQDRLVRWHRFLGPYAIWLIGAHFVFILFGYAGTVKTGVVSQMWEFVAHVRWLLPATVGFWLFVLVGITSYKQVRRRMKYEVWWVTHLYIYVGILLAFMHQVELGQAFVRHFAAKVFWLLLIVGSLGVLVLFRWLVPLARSQSMGLKVARVVRESEDTISLWISGKNLERLRAKGGQFFAWRFMTPELWWHSHPFSVSASPRSDMLRITIRDLGDTSRALASLPVGTRVIAEGPYGVFTAESRHSDKVLLIAGGVGITPIRAVLEDLPAKADVYLLYRVPDRKSLVLWEELDKIAAARPNTTVRYLVGSRREHPIDARTLAHMVPQVSVRDWYVCGPHPLVNAARTAAEVLGVPASRVHHEEFAFLP